MNLEQFNITKSFPKFNREWYELGHVAEREVLNTWREYFEDETISPLHEGDQFDFTEKDNEIEFKSRTVNSLNYEDTRKKIGVQEFNKSRLMEGVEEHFYVIKFMNGLYYQEILFSH